MSDMNDNKNQFENPKKKKKKKIKIIIISLSRSNCIDHLKIIAADVTSSKEPNAITYG